MKYLLIVLSILVVWFLIAKLGNEQSDDDGNILYICRGCFEKRYTNTWLGFRIRSGTCQVCHKDKLVDRVPVDHLNAKEKDV